MASYEFTRRSDGKGEMLETVERELVSIVDPSGKINPDRFHPCWDPLITLLIGRLMKFGGWSLEPHMWSWVAASYGQCVSDETARARHEAAVLFLQSKYHFSAWR